jgi:hypothetical protein
MLSANASTPYDCALRMSASQSDCWYGHVMPTMKCAKTSLSDEPEAGAGSPTASGREALPGAGERVVGDGLCDEVVAGELDDEGAAEEPDEGAALWEDAGTTALSEEVAAVETEEAEAEAEAEDADEDSLDEAGVAAVGTSSWRHYH